jgi:hypothetical protein
VLPRDKEILETLRRKGSRVLSLRDLVKVFDVDEADEEDLGSDWTGSSGAGRSPACAARSTRRSSTPA